MDANGNMSPADYAAVSGNGNLSSNNWWIAILFMFFIFGWGGNQAPMPNVATQSGVQNGFDHAAVVNELNGLNAQVTSGFANAEVSRANQQMSYLQGMNGIQSGIADLKYTVATENCADRNALSQGLNDIKATITSGIQSIHDKLCQQEIERKNDEIQRLRTQLDMANLSASQTAQTSRIVGQNNIQTQEIINRLATPTPIPAYIVANPFTGTTGGGTDATKVSA